MTKHSGSLLVEVLISITIFIIGLMALIGAITYSVGSIMKSREDIGGDMEITNKTEMDAMRLTLSPDIGAIELSGKNSGTVDATLAPQSGDKDSNNQEISLNCGLYLYEYESGKRRGTAFYLLQREKP
ncbi:MAG: hypothetical protein LUH49_12485 [Cloacibacillus porcorum]|uniref:type IV pilus modification PilV family protein n=1 Tax=Cloacibacillus porcorum TaxID=1197717 RepID=UPI0023F1DC07|nr:hypothetical protein [Cloacibacillus porcorum]MCD7877752.1 hypothetical protein [Cloacibacillus porcorum]